MKSLYLLPMLAVVMSAYSQNGPAPEVSADGRVTFHLKSTNAQSVLVQCESLPRAAMVKDDQGVWSYTTPALEPDFYGYSFVVDGVRALDLNNPLQKYNLLGTESQFHIPGPTSLAWEVNDVPHGVVHRHFYHSKAAGDDRAFFVYTPPGYSISGPALPVFCLLHGFSDDASAWCSVGQANIIFDNLIALGEAKPMVVVMPLGYGTLEVLYRGGRTREPGFNERNTNQFRASLMDEALPQVEAAYHVSSDRNQRAIAGLSMGGAESLTVGLNNLDHFSWIGAFSSGGVGTNFASTFPTLDATANDRLHLLWVACGKEDGLFEPNRKFVEWLDSKGVHHNWTETAGAHSWRVWRRNLAAFTPLLFK